MPNKTLIETGMIVFGDYVNINDRNAAHRTAKYAWEIAEEENRQLEQRIDDQRRRIEQLEASRAQARSQIGVYEEQKSICVCGYLVFLFFIYICYTIFRYFLAILF